MRKVHDKIKLQYSAEYKFSKRYPYNDLMIELELQDNNSKGIITMDKVNGTAETENVKTF